MPGGGIRELCTTIAHRPLKSTNAQRFLFALGMMNDVIIEKHRQGVKAHCIDDADESALTYIGNDRLVTRGITETADSYRARLKSSLDDLQRAGNAWAVLSQVRGYLLAYTPAARTVSAQYTSTGTATLANWQEYLGTEAQGVPPVFTRDLTGNWDWDSVSPTTGSWGWWRWYLILDSVTPNDWIGPAPTWGGTGTTWGGYSGTWGTDAPQSVGVTLKIIIRQWKSSMCHWVVISFDASLFVSTGSAGTENPGGEYGRWSKIVNGVYVRARSSDARYFEGEI